MEEDTEGGHLSYKITALISKYRGDVENPHCCRVYPQAAEGDE